MLINASEKFKLLNKSKGAKRKEVDEASRLEIVKTLTQYQNTDYAQVFDKDFFYSNKQFIMLTNLDEKGNSFEAQLPLVTNKKTGLEERASSLELTPTKLSNGERELNEFVITTFDSSKYTSLSDFFEQDIKPFITSLDCKEQPIVVTTTEAKYWFDAEKETLIKEMNGNKVLLGCGKIVVTSSYKKVTKKNPERIEISIELIPDYEKDYEIIPFHRAEAANKEAIATFMAKYVTKPFAYLENVVGVELNFNKVFYKPEKLRDVVDILAEIDAIDGELKELEARLAL
jgi:type I restriction enzyme M protein